MKNLGQHFLKNRSALQSMAASLEIIPDDAVIEIGPGHGELTEFLETSVAKKIVLIEKDNTLCGYLADRFRGDDRVAIINWDALQTLPRITCEVEFKKGTYKIAGNIPYYITGHLFRILGEMENKPALCLFTVQKEVAERICAQPPRMNRLAASVQFRFDVKIIKTLPASDFSPPPKVASAIISLKRINPVGYPEKYYAAMRALFAQPRKMIGNNLARGTGQPINVITEKLSPLPIRLSCRPQDLSIKDIAAVAELLF